jgi:hypothetical protein
MMETMAPEAEKLAHWTLSPPFGPSELRRPEPNRCQGNQFTERSSAIIVGNVFTPRGSRHLRICCGER